MLVTSYSCTVDVITQRGMQRKSQMTHRKLMRYNMSSGWQNLEKHNIRKCETYTLDNTNLLLLLLNNKIFHSLTNNIFLILFLHPSTQTSICPNTANWYVTDPRNSHNVNQ